MYLYPAAGNSNVKIFKFDASNNSWPTTATSIIYSDANMFDYRTLPTRTLGKQ